MNDLISGYLSQNASNKVDSMLKAMSIMVRTRLNITIESAEG